MKYIVKTKVKVLSKDVIIFEIYPEFIRNYPKMNKFIVNICSKKFTKVKKGKIHKFHEKN